MTPTVPSLHGVRVLDLSRILAGPFCAMLLADLGAEVIKIEDPAGDDSRLFGPFVNGDSAYYRLFNRGKFGITLDLRRHEGADQFVRLARRADVVIENFRPGVMERLGLPVTRLLHENPRLTVLSITGFGQHGPLRDAPAYDLIAQAMSGLMSVTGWPDGQPTRTGVSLGDLIPGLYGALATVASLHERIRTGHGQHIDLAMLDSLISVLESVGMRALHELEEPVATGNDHAMTAPFSTYPTKDGSIAIAVSNDKLFGRLATALDRQQWLGDRRFANYADRDPNRQALRDEMVAAMSALTTDEVLDRLSSHGVPASKVLSVREALDQDHVRARQLVVTEPDGFQTLGSPMRLTGSVPPRAAPGLGEHNAMLSSWLEEPERSGREV
ncbi:MAG TPA: CoA transferase [Marmoricola sp.]|nr:CoA transferase [Marmoricola sp.]